MYRCIPVFAHKRARVCVCTVDVNPDLTKSTNTWPISFPWKYLDARYSFSICARLIISAFFYPYIYLLKHKVLWTNEKTGHDFPPTWEERLGLNEGDSYLTVCFANISQSVVIALPLYRYISINFNTENPKYESKVLKEFKYWKEKEEKEKENI